MKNNKIGKIVKYNLEKNLRNKWFIGLNILLLVISIVSMNFGAVKNILKDNNLIPDDEKIVVEIVDETNKLNEKLIENATKNNVIKNVEIVEVDSVIYDDTMSEDKIIIEVINSDANIIDSKVISKDGIDNNYYTMIEESLESIKKEIACDKYNLTEQEIQVLKDSVKIERIMVGVDSSNSDIKQIAQTLVNYITFFILILILSKIATDISQEKVTKSIEYVLTSISAKDYLLAKVISIILTMVIQLVFIIIYFIISSSINSIIALSISEVAMETASSFSLASIANLIDGHMVLYVGIVLVFLVLTVFLMCIIQAALTSKTTNISEAGNTTTILMTIIFVLYFVSTLVITPVKQINIIIYILSCLPIVSMFFVPTMIIIGQANVIQIIIATILLILSIPVALKICSKVFKNGVLDNYNKKKKVEKYNKAEKNLKDIEINKLKKREFAKYGYVIGMSVILYVAVQLVATYAISLFIAPLSNLTGISVDSISMLSNMIVFIISLLVPALFVKAYVEEDKVENRKVDKKSMAKVIIMSVPIVAAVQIGLGILLEKLGLNYDIVDKMNLYNNTSVLSSILFFIYIAVLPAIFEELYIRKSVLKFSQKYGNTFAIVSSALLFSIIHLNISQSLFAFIMGVILAVIAIYSNSIMPTAIIHLLNNGYAALTMIFENNEVILTTVNMIYLVMIIIGTIFIIMSVIKNKNSIKECITKLKENKGKKVKNDYRHIALDYTFIIACILMIVMLILTQKTIAIL